MGSETKVQEVNKQANGYLENGCRGSLIFNICHWLED